MEYWRMKSLIEVMLDTSGLAFKNVLSLDVWILGLWWKSISDTLWSTFEVMLSLFWTIDTGFELLGYFLMGLVTSTRLSLRWQINAHDLLKLVQSLCFGSSLAFYFHSILNRDLCMLLSSFFFCWNSFITPSGGLDETLLSEGGDDVWEGYGTCRKWTLRVSSLIHFLFFLSVSHVRVTCDPSAFWLLGWPRPHSLPVTPSWPWWTAPPLEI